jgi:hypothetical protein
MEAETLLVVLEQLDKETTEELDNNMEQILEEVVAAAEQAQLEQMLTHQQLAELWEMAEMEEWDCNLL